MNKVCETLFSALRSALFGNEINVDEYRNLSSEEWQQLFRMSAQQGVVAIVYEVIAQLPREIQPSKTLNIKWALSAEAIEKRYQRQFDGARQLCELWSSYGIRTVVMKGLSLSRYYINPSHRECGDFDCYLLDNRYEDGNVLAEQKGAIVNREWYKHSQIFFRGIMVENHQFLVTTRKGESLKLLNSILDRYLCEKELQAIDNTHILLPPTDFTALFVTYHSFSHFISEGITLRHLCDWACFLRVEQDNFDWGEFYEMCKKFKFDRFVDVSNEIITKYLGVELSNNAIVKESPYTKQLLEDILFEDAKVFNSGKGKWFSRFKLVRNMFTYSWKYRYIARSSSMKYLWQIVSGYLFKRENH